MGAHIIEKDGKRLFQSDKYPTCPAGKVPLSTKDKTAQDLLWEYAQRRRVVDAEFSDDLEAALREDGYVPPERTPMAVLLAMHHDYLVAAKTKWEAHYRNAGADDDERDDAWFYADERYMDLVFGLRSFCRGPADQDVKHIPFLYEKTRMDFRSRLDGTIPLHAPPLVVDP
jgi:hypothetical protein